MTLATHRRDSPVEEIAMIKSLLIKLIRNLFGASPRSGYQRRIEPTIGRAIVFDDTEDYWPLGTADDAIWTTDDLPQMQSQLDSSAWDGHDSSFDFAHLQINPASGLPMVDDVTDVAGNVYGMDFTSTDFSTDWI